MRYELKVGASGSFAVGGDVYDSLDIDVLPSATGGHDTVRLVAAPGGGVMCVYGSKTNRAGLDDAAMRAVRQVTENARRRERAAGEPDPVRKP